MSTIEHIEATLRADTKLPRFRIDPNQGKYRVVAGSKIITHFSNEYANRDEAENIMAQLNRRYNTK